MPELPEVETIVRELQTSGIVGRKIMAVDVLWPRTVSPSTPKIFSDKLVSQKIFGIARRGKWIVIDLGGERLYVHLRMTGKLHFGRETEEIHPHERLRMHFDDGRILIYEDQRKFGRWALYSAEEKLGLEIGIEPLSEEFTWDYFKTLLKEHRQVIKVLLLNQRYIAGLGNIYVDEALWEAGIHPRKKSDEINVKEAKKLFGAIPEVLRRGIANMGTSLGGRRSNYSRLSGERGTNQNRLHVFRREGEFCERCGG